MLPAGLITALTVLSAMANEMESMRKCGVPAVAGGEGINPCVVADVPTLHFLMFPNRQRLAELMRQPRPADVPAVQPPARPTTYPARRVARMLTADLAALAEPDRVYVEQLLALSPALATVRDLVQRFATLVCAHTAEALTPWLTDVGHGKLRGFAAGLRQDEQAVHAALTLPWSSGQVEEQVTRLKQIKRQGYERAKLDLLKACLIHAA